MPKLPNLQTYEDLYNYAKQNGLDETKWILRLFIELGQPDGFMEGFTSRAMCRAAGAGLDGLDEMPLSHSDTTHGKELYNFMWGQTK